MNDELRPFRMTDHDRAHWLADKICIFGDYAKEAADFLKVQAEIIDSMNSQLAVSREIAADANAQLNAMRLELATERERSKELFEAFRAEQLVSGELRIAVGAERERADGLQRVVDAARKPYGVAFVHGKTPDGGNHIVSRESLPIGTELYAAAPVPAQPAEYVGWYCAQCQTGVDSRDVTFSEQHNACGRVITDDRPPAQPAVVPEGFGLPLSQEPKYTTNAMGRLVNRATGVAIPDDEPVFIFRAKDRAARYAISDYATRLLNGPHQNAVRKRERQFADFKEAHPDRIGEPDTAILSTTDTEGRKDE